MCWNAKVSILFGFFHLFTCGVVSIKQKPYHRNYQLFTVFFACMEFLQAFQWIFGNLTDDITMGCSNINKISTVGAYILIWLQPILFSCLDNEIITFAFKLGVMAFIGGLWNLLRGMFMTENNYIIANTNFHNDTCTYIGDHHHLLWKFAFENVDHVPNHFLYLILSLATFYHYQNKAVRNVLFVGWFGSLLFAMSTIGFGPELPAYWCFVSVSADLAILFL